MRNLRQIRAIAAAYAKLALRPTTRAAKRFRGRYQDYLGGHFVTAEKKYAWHKRMNTISDAMGIKRPPGTSSDIFDQAGKELDINPNIARKAHVKTWSKPRRAAHEAYRFSRKHPVVTGLVGADLAVRGLEQTPMVKRFKQKEEAKKKAYLKKNESKIRARVRMLTQT